MDYWDVESLLAEEEPIKVEFLKPIPDYGHLISTSQQDLDPATAVKEGTPKADIPLWLATELLEREIVNIGVPKYFSDQFKNSLQADPAYVNIKDKTSYFYEVALKLFPILTEEAV